MAQRLPNPSHLLRGILRECTYLPDPAARKFMHRRTVLAFKKYRVSYPPIYVQLHRINRAWDYLTLLRRANQGYLKSLERVLMMTYARSGVRRTQIMRRIMVPDIPQDNKAVEDLEVVPKYQKGWKPNALFQTLLKSQMQHRSRFDRSVRGRQNLSTQKSIPEKNSWGRPMPLRRVRNLNKRWYAKVADDILPPLPEAEVKELQEKILRPSLAARLKKRRTQVGDWERKDWSVLSEDLLLKGPRKDPTFDREGRPHKITPRILRSIWRKVLIHTPVITWQNAQNRWDVKWSDPEIKRARIATTTTEQAKLLFGMVGDDTPSTIEGAERPESFKGHPSPS